MKSIQSKYIYMLLAITNRRSNEQAHPKFRKIKTLFQ